MENINKELNGLRIVEIYHQDHFNFNPFKNGILFISANVCFWTVGKSPGFKGNLKKSLFDYGVEDTWQLASVSGKCFHNFTYQIIL